MTRYRRAGDHWRFQAYRMRPGGGSGAAVTLFSHPHERPKLGDPALEERMEDGSARFGVEQVIPGCEFDELVIGKFFHIEQMDTGLWWMNIGGLVVHVKADRDGRPTDVWSEGVEVPEPGCTYDLDGVENPEEQE